MKKKVITLTIVVLIAAVILAEQTLDQKIAQLEMKLAEVSGKEKVEVLNELSAIYYNKSAKKCIEFAEQAIALSQKTGNLPGEANALRNMAIGYSIMGDHEKGLACFQKARRIFTKAGDKQGAVRALSNTGSVYNRMGDYNKALRIFLEVLKLEQESGTKTGVARTMFNLGTVYSNLGKFDISLDYFLQALKLREELGNKQEIADSLSNIGLLYLELGEPARALEYMETALITYETSGNKRLIADTANSIGDAYLRLKDFKKALPYLQKALKMSAEIGDKRGQAYALGNIADLHMRSGNHELALDYFIKSVKISEEMGDKWGISKTIVKIGKIYGWLGNYELGLENIDRGFEVGKKMNKKELIRDAYECYSELYSTRGDYKKALEYYKLFHQTDKEIFNIRSSERIAEMQTRYDTLKKEKENEILKNKNKIQDLRLSRARFSRNAFITGFILVSIILILIFKKYLYLFAFWKKEKYIGQFRLVEKVGSGAMGAIYKAHSIVDKSKIYAVKILREELFSDKNSKTRFRREGVIIDKLEHPNIIKIYERGESREKLFIAMEFLKGIVLENKIMAEGKIDIKESIHIMIQVADALAFIHKKNIIHRDLKPENIMLIEKDGDPNFVKLLDFGLARMEFQTKLTQSGNFVGTIEYISPEQMLNADSSPANDIFSLGVTFYRMLSGQSPFSGEMVVEVMRKVIKEEPPQVAKIRPDIPGKLNNLIMKMLAKKPEQRPTAEAVLKTLRQL